jgi:hypothetical protein
LALASEAPGRATAGCSRQGSMSFPHVMQDASIAGFTLLRFGGNCAQFSALDRCDQSARI